MPTRTVTTTASPFFPSLRGLIDDGRMSNDDWSLLDEILFETSRRASRQEEEEEEEEEERRGRQLAPTEIPTLTSLGIGSGSNRVRSTVGPLAADIEAETVKEGIKYFLYLDSLLEAQIGDQEEVSGETPNGEDEVESREHQRETSGEEEIHDSGIAFPPDEENAHFQTIIDDEEEAEEEELVIEVEANLEANNVSEEAESALGRVEKETNRNNNNNDDDDGVDGEENQLKRTVEMRATMIKAEAAMYRESNESLSAVVGVDDDSKQREDRSTVVGRRGGDSDVEAKRKKGETREIEGDAESEWRGVGGFEDGSRLISNLRRNADEDENTNGQIHDSDEEEERAALIGMKEFNISVSSLEDEDRKRVHPLCCLCPWIS